MNTDGPMIWLLSDDLIDVSKTTGSALPLGYRVKRLRTIDELMAPTTEWPVSLILDLQTAGLDLEALFRQFGNPRPRVIAYGSHVDAARLSAARQAGCDFVMPRSRYFEDVPTKLKEWIE